jgi:hypothetical protein
MSVKVKDSVDVSSLDRSVVRRIMAAVGFAAAAPCSSFCVPRPWALASAIPRG